MFNIIIMNKDIFTPEELKSLENFKNSLNEEDFEEYYQEQVHLKQAGAPKGMSMENFDLANLPGKSVSDFFNENGYCAFEDTINGQEYSVTLFEEKKGVYYQTIFDSDTKEMDYVYIGAYQLTDDVTPAKIIKFPNTIVNEKPKAIEAAKKLLK